MVFLNGVGVGGDIDGFLQFHLFAEGGSTERTMAIILDEPFVDAFAMVDVFADIDLAEGWGGESGVRRGRGWGWGWKG